MSKKNKEQKQKRFTSLTEMERISANISVANMGISLVNAALYFATQKDCATSKKMVKNSAKYLNGIIEQLLENQTR
ncbi:MAG: hypothetical protein M0R32_11940 [Candidatus Cloacimonetes bacterium]|jgi:hypothetical protein|nr:hypothetical protein [Candidatus Cloacimonadota bacterium]